MEYKIVVYFAFVHYYKTIDSIEYRSFLETQNTRGRALKTISILTCTCIINATEIKCWRSCKLTRMDRISNTKI